MKVTPLNDDNGYRCLAIEAPWSDLAADYDDIVSAYSQVQLPGFRPGKVPRSVIEQRLQKAIIEELSHRAAHRLGREALRQSGAESFGPVEAVDIECAKGMPFRFTTRFWPMPAFELPDLDSLVIRYDGSDIRDQISHRLLDTVSFEVPDDAVRAELDEEGGDGPEAWKAAFNRVRLMLILNRLAEKEGIEVSEADVEQRIKEKAREFGMPSEVLTAELQEGRGRQRLRDMLLAESTLEYLIERSTHTKGDAE